MQTIKNLLGSHKGRRFLDHNAITTDVDAFAAQLETPVNPILQQYLGTGIDKPVYAFQQIYVDVTQSMLDRIYLLDDLVQFEGIAPFFLWIDTDRAGSDKIATRMYWPHWGRVQTIPVCPGAMKDIESRFVELDPAQLEAAIDKLGMYLIQSVNGATARAVAKTKHQRLQELFLNNHALTLSTFNHRVTYFLLNEYVKQDPVSVLVSDLLTGDFLTTGIEVVVNHIEAVIRTFNQARSDLMRQDINPVVKPLNENYLPLNYSCPHCGHRLRLRREIAGRDQYATATCRCKGTYRFYLGNGTLSIAELVQTKRWSPDVSLALFMNDLVSGFVGGQSSGVYFGLLMKAALEQVLGKRRVPVLLPASLESGSQEEFDSLIYRYLTERLIQIKVPEVVR